MTRDQAQELREAAARNPNRPMAAFARPMAELVEDLPPSGPIRSKDEPPLFEGGTE